MKETMMMFGFLWAGILAVCVLGYVAFRVLDRIERWKQAKRHARKVRALSDRIMADVAALERAHRAGQIPDFPRPMGVPKPETGYILESRVFIPGDTDQDVIARLTGEVQ